MEALWSFKSQPCKAEQVIWRIKLDSAKSTDVFKVRRATGASSKRRESSHAMPSPIPTTNRRLRPAYTATSSITLG